MKNRTRTGTRFLSIVLAVMMVVGMLPATALAAEETTVVLPSGVITESFGDNTVTDGTTYYATMTAALAGIHGTDNAFLYCKPGANVGAMTHGHVCKSLTVYGNGAYISGGEQDFELGMPSASGNSCTGLTGDVTLTVYDLNGCGAWGTKATEHTVNLVFENCQNMGKVLLTGTTGTLNITMTDCAFEGVIKEAVYSNADGAITLSGVEFSNLNKAVNLNHKATGTQTVTLDRCTFTNCGSNVANDEIPVRVLSSVVGGKSVLTVTDCSFSGTPAGGADILLDYGVGTTTANVSGTAANVLPENADGNAEMVAVTADKTYSNVEPAVTYVAEVDGTKYTDLQEAITAAADGGTVTLLSDLTIESDLNNAGKGYFNIADGQKVTIDLNGKTIDVTDNSTGNFIVFYNYGELTIKNGTVNLTATNNRLWNAQSTIILNRGGVLNIESGTYAHNGGTDMAITICNSGNWYGDATANIEGGTITSTYIAIRNRMEQNEHGASGEAILNVSGGTISGTSRAVWAQAASVSETAPATGTINVSGGKVGLIDTPRSNGAVSMTTISGGTVEAFKGEVGELTVTDKDAITGDVTILTAAGEAADYVVTADGLYAQAAAKIGSTNYATLTEALAAVQEGETIQLMPGTIAEGTIKLPATLKDVTFMGADNKATILKDMKIMASDGNSFSYVGLTFDGITFDNSRLLFTGWRNGDEIIENLTVTNCVFQNLYDTTNEACVHINKEASEPVKNFTFTNNVIDGATGGSKSGIYSVNTGDVIITGNTFNNIVFRPALVQLADCDGVADDVVVSNNVISNTTRLQIYGTEEDNGDDTYTPIGTDTLEIAITGNIFKNISGYYICTWGINGESDISENYYDSEDLGGKIFWNNEKPATEAGLAELGVYPVYTKLNEDGTINEESAYTPDLTYAAQVGETNYATLADAVAAVKANGGTLTLLADANESVTFNYPADGAPTEITIDLNGFTVTSAESTLWVSDGYVVTVKDSSDPSTGKIISTNTGGEAIAITRNGHVVLESGYVYNDFCAVWMYNATENGTFVMNGGTLEVPNGGQTLSVGAGKATINGGKILCNKIPGGGGWNTLVYENGTLEITGGEFLGTVGSYGTASISGGTFSYCDDPNDGFNSDHLAAGYSTKTNADGSITVYALPTSLSGSGTAEDPFLINNLDDLKFFRDSVNNGTRYNGQFVKLNADIDLNDEEWTPIGDRNVDQGSFLGTFDGDNHTISNLQISKWTKTGAGFFSKVGLQSEYVSGTVKNVTFNNVTITSPESYVGVIAQAPSGALIENVHITGDVNISGYGYVGGIAGHGYPTINNCSVEAEGTITANYWGAGAILGFAGDHGAKISNATVTGVDVHANYGGAASVAGSPYGAAITGTTTVKNVAVTSNSDYYMSYIAGGGKISGEITMENVTATANGEPITPGDVAAEVNGELYFFLQEAIDAAQAGETITLLRDVEVTEKFDLTGVNLDLNEKTLFLMTTGNYIVDTVTISNGTIDVTGNSVNGNTFFTVGGQWAKAGSVLNLDKVSLIGDGYHTDWAVICVHNGTSLNMTNSTVNLKNDNGTAGGFIKDTSGNNNTAVVTIKDTELTLTNVDRGFTGAKVNLDTVTLTITGGEHGINGSELSITNSTVSISDGTGRGITLNKYNSSIVNSTVTLTNMGEGGIRFKTANALTVDDDSTLNECSAHADVAGATLNGQEVSGTEDDMSTVAVANGETTVINPGLKGEGTEASPYLIENLDDLIFFRNSVNAGETKYNAAGVYVALAADIDMADQNWVGIGSATAEHGFMGNFDGKNYKIKNLTITNPDLDSDGFAYAGLFGITEGVDKNDQNTIKNLIIENVTISTTGHIVAAAVAYPYYTKLDNITVTGNISITGGDYTAGVVAYTRRCVDASNLTISGNTGSTITGRQTVGGVISDIQMNGGLTANYSKFSASNLTISGEQSVGGISGIISGQTLNTCTVEDVTLDCSDARVGTVSGALGAASVITNATVNNVTGASAIIGGNYDGGAPVEAKIGDKYYATLEAALAANVEGDVVLLAPITIAAGQTVTIDLNGKTISYTSAIAGEAMITNNGNLTITDGTAGKIVYTYTGVADSAYTKGNYTINNSGKLTVENGTIENATAEMSHAFYAINNGNGGTVVIDGGKIVNTNNYAVRLFGNGSLTVNGGEISGTRAVWMQAPGSNADDTPTISLTVNGGTLTGTGESEDYKLAVYSYSYGNSMKNVSITVEDGVIDGDIALTGGKNKTVAETVTITGGTITDIYSYATDDVAGQTINVSGGTFQNAVAGVYCADGYIPADNDDGTYGVKVTLPEVVITDIKDSLKDSDPDLTFALNFAIKDVENLTDEYLEKLMEAYGDYYTDYVLTISGLTDSSVTFNANDGNADGYLAGQYDAWSENWVSVPFEDVSIQNGESLYIMEYAAKLMGKQGLRFTLAEVAAIVQNFDCGVYFTPEFLAANPGLKVDLELKVFIEDENGTKINDISVATNEFDVEDIVAAVTADGKQTQYFDTLAKALAAAQDGDTVTMLADAALTESLVLNTEGTITIDGNGHEITQATGYTDTQNGLIMLGATTYGDAEAATHKYTIKDVVFDDISDWSVVRSQGVTLTMDGCTIQNCAQTNGQSLIRLDFTEATIKNTAIKSNNALMAIAHNFNGNGSNSKLTVDECVIEGNTFNKTAAIYYVVGGGCEIKKSEFVDNKVNAADNTAVIYLGFQDNCTVTGNLFKNNAVTDSSTSTRVAGAIFAGYQASITGNAFDGNTATNANGDVLGQICISTYYEDGYVDLNNNYWNGGAPVYGKDYTIQHQTGSGDFGMDSYYTDYALDANGNVVLSGEETNTFVAKIGTKKYNSLTEAFAAAQSGKTVKLMRDAEETLVAVTPGVTLDLNGQTLTAAMVYAVGAIVDSTDGDALLKVSKGSISLNSAQNDLPLYDVDNSGYRFFKYDLHSYNGAGQVIVTNGVPAFYFTIFCDNANAYALMATGESELSARIEAIWDQNDASSGAFFAYKDSHIKDFGTRNGLGIFYVNISGAADKEQIIVTPEISTASGFTCTGEQIAYTPVK